MSGQSKPDQRVVLHLERLEPGRTPLELDHRLVRESQVLQGHEIEGFEVAVRGELAVDNLDQKVLVHGEFLARREMVCHRSGERFELEYPVETEIVVYRTPQRGGDAEFGEDDNWVIHQPSGFVDLTEAVLEAVVLDEPQRVVHPDHEGADEDEQNDEDDEIDPRWEALRQLREQAGDEGDGDAGDR